MRYRYSRSFMSDRSDVETQSDDREPDGVTITAFGHRFIDYPSGLAEDLITLERKVRSTRTLRTTKPSSRTAQRISATTESLFSRVRSFSTLRPRSPFRSSTVRQSARARMPASSPITRSGLRAALEP